MRMNIPHFCGSHFVAMCSLAYTYHPEYGRHCKHGCDVELGFRGGVVIVAVAFSLPHVAMRVPPTFDEIVEVCGIVDLVD